MWCLEMNLLQRLLKTKMVNGHMKSIREMIILMILFNIQIIKIMFFIKIHLKLRLKKFINRFSIRNEKLIHLNIRSQITKGLIIKLIWNFNYLMNFIFSFKLTNKMEFKEIFFIHSALNLDGFIKFLITKMNLAHQLCGKV